MGLLKLKTFDHIIPSKRELNKIIFKALGLAEEERQKRFSLSTNPNSKFKIILCKNLGKEGLKRKQKSLWRNLLNRLALTKGLPFRT